MIKLIKQCVIDETKLVKIWEKAKITLQTSPDETMKQLTFLLMLLGLVGCNDFMSPNNMAEGVEAEERCNNWQEETRKETIRFGMDYSLFNRACKLNESKTMILGYEGEYETGNSQKDREIRATWTVVTTFELTKT